MKQKKSIIDQLEFDEIQTIDIEINQEYKPDHYVSKLTEKKDIFNYHCIFFDFEILPRWGCVCFYIWKNNHITKHLFVWDADEHHTKVADSIRKLKNFIKDTVDEYIFIGWNVKYDKSILHYIIEESTQSDCSNETMKDRFFELLFLKSCKLIKPNKDEKQEFLSFKLDDYKDILFYDAMSYLVSPVSLKTTAGELGFDIVESTVKFDKKDLTYLEKQELIAYNINDVDVLLRVFITFEPYFEIRRDLTKKYAKRNSSVEYKNGHFFKQIFGDVGVDSEYSKKHNQNSSDSNETIISEEKDIKTYSFYEDIYLKNKNVHRVLKVLYEDNPNLSTELKELWERLKYEQIPLAKSKWCIIFNYMGLEVKFALGGIHGSLEDYFTDDIAVMDDVTSFYPFMMINYELQNQNIQKDPNKRDFLLQIIKERVEAKKSKDPIINRTEKTLKVLINAYYGLLRSGTSAIVDFKSGTSVCILGQLLLLGLSDLLKDDIKTMIQLNTDGIYYIPKEGHQQQIQEKRKWFMELTNLGLEEERTVKTFNRDVNNYVIEFEEKNKETQQHKLKTKGSFINQIDLNIKKPTANNMRFDYWIVGKIISEFLVNRKHPDKVFAENKELWKYASVKKINHNYDFLYESKPIQLDLSKYLDGINNLSDQSLKNVVIDDINIVSSKVNRFFNVKNNGKSYKKYAFKKEVNKDFNLDDFEVINDVSKTNKEQLIINDKNLKLVLTKNKKGEWTLRNNGIKSYNGEKPANLSESAIIYNKSLIKNTKDNYDLKTYEYLTVDDVDFEIDYDWYVRMAYQLWFKDTKIYSEWVKRFPWLKLKVD